jgi:Leucine-rich repeat (LRR) protein
MLSLVEKDTILEDFPEDLFRCKKNCNFVIIDVYSKKAPKELYRVNKAINVSLEFHPDPENLEFNHGELNKQVQTFHNAQLLFLGNFWEINQLFNKPSNFSNLKKLYLNYSDQKLNPTTKRQPFPKGLDQLPKLELLDIAFINFNSFDLQNTTFPKLKNLMLSSDLAQKMNLHLDKFTAPLLKELSIDYLIVNPQEFTILLKKHSGTLQSLKLEQVNLPNIHQGLKTCTALKELKLYKIGFTSFPIELTELYKLKKLAFVSMSIAQLPNEFQKLKALTQLDLSNNGLTQMPIQITTLSNLKKLNLSMNPIQSIPSEIQNLKKLQYLNLLGSSLDENTKELLKKWLPKTKIYY